MFIINDAMQQELLCFFDENTLPKLIQHQELQGNQKLKSYTVVRNKSTISRSHYLTAEVRLWRAR